MTLLSTPHHDGSALYVEPLDWRVGGVARVRLRVPHETGIDLVALRYTHDGEQACLPMTPERSDALETWWMHDMPLVNPLVSYRFLLSSGKNPDTWLNATGLHPHDTPDADDFVVRVDVKYPEWPTRSVVYQVFPDRFATSDLDVPTPEWAVRRAWTDLPAGPDWSSELFGGDLYGAAEHLDHVARLGADVVYLTPFFTARSAHRYDASTFDEVDPLLGGNAGLEALTKQAHAWNMRVMGDLTLNHCGAVHPWYVRAKNVADAVEREYFYFEPGADGIERPATWLGVSSLIKLNFASHALRDVVYRHRDAIARRWLHGENGLDGWRIDVANMMARRLAHDVSHEVSGEFVDACQDTKSDAYVVGEHFQDGRADMAHGGWHGVMAYSAFTRPVWAWLRCDELPAEFPQSFLGSSFGVPKRDGVSMVSAMRAFTAGVPFDAVLRSWLILDSHDTPRFHVLAGDRARTKVGVGLQMSLPGVPMVWMGDEIGLGGTSCGEDSRRPMPWNRENEWDHDLFAWYAQCIALRRVSDALAVGSLRWVHVGSDVVVYLRESADERILCAASRAVHAPVQMDAVDLDCERMRTLVGSDAAVVDGRVVLPADGPAFHMWRLSGGSARFAQGSTQQNASTEVGRG
ncbi:MAG: alpha-amylase family glycosyl hydrolase [Actinomycetota bacterium]